MKMNITLDLDETITAAPEFFAWLSKHIRLDGGKVYVMTDRSPYARTFTEEELAYYGIEYDELLITEKKLEESLKRNVDFAIDNLAGTYFHGKKISCPDGIQIADLKKDRNEKTSVDEFYDKFKSGWFDS
jgi:hypothetical protein